MFRNFTGGIQIDLTKYLTPADAWRITEYEDCPDPEDVEAIIEHWRKTDQIKP